MAGTYRSPALDTQFMRAWSPARFAVLGLTIFVALLVISPLTYEVSGFSLDAVAYAGVVLLGFFGGCQLGRFVNNLGPPAVVQPVSMSPDLMINATLVLGLIGVSARAYDRVIVRGFTIADTLLETRETVAETLSPFAYLGGIFFSFGIVAVMLIWLSSSHRRRPVAYAVALLLASYPMLETLLQGGRSATIHSLFLFFMAARTTNVMSWLTRSPVALGVAGIAVVAAAQLFYEIRTLQGTGDDIDIVDIFRYASLARYTQPWEWVTDHLVTTNGQGLISEFLKVWTHVTQYLTHSWLVYCDSYRQFDGTVGWGRMHFFIPFRVWSALSGDDLSYDSGLYGMEVGLSTTAFSTIYYDFGALGPFVAVAFGYVATVIQRKAIRFPERWLPLYVYLCFACLMMMLDNQLIGSLGAFAIWSFILYVPIHYLVTILSEPVGTSEATVPTSMQEMPELRQRTP